MHADLDHAATTPPRPEVLEVLSRWMRSANASARHLDGQAARQAVEHAREQAATALGCSPHEVVFTSGGTEANNLAIKGVAWAAGRSPGPRPHIVTTAIEHLAVLETAQWLAARGDIELDVVAPRPDGTVDPEQVLAAVRPTTVLVSVMGANNELGSINDIPTLGAALRARGVALHVDAVQCLATLDVDVRAWSVDALALSAHKIGGPQGVGVAVLRRELPIEPLSHGGGQDRGVRSGTFAVGLIAACGQALETAVSERVALRGRLAALSERLAAGITALDGVVRTGPSDPADRLVSHVHVAIDGVDGDALALALDQVQIAASSGSACSSGSGRTSHVVEACGIVGTPLRLTLGWTTTEAEVDHAIAALQDIVPQLRAGGPSLSLRPVGDVTSGVASGAAGPTDA
jgi:cysteine desulfurase